MPPHHVDLSGLGRDHARMIWSDQGKMRKTVLLVELEAFTGCKSCSQG
ncbi:hypothetical protein N826_28525 [Skermanella aerolata KACC 11604]|nr:hypothetical protein N826_28525 [Skermanella aerolata KACC 11604]